MRDFLFPDTKEKLLLVTRSHLENKKILFIGRDVINIISRCNEIFRVIFLYTKLMVPVDFLTS